jgi:polyphenol oxidase
MAELNFIRYKVFDAYPELEAFTTTRKSFSGENVRFTGKEESVYSNNRKKLAQLLGIETGQLVFPRQTHTATVCCVDESPETEIQHTDALISDKKGLCLCVQTADCVPILLFDPVKKVVAAIHAGWRGTVSRIVANTIRKMKQNYGSCPEDIRAAIGPSISPSIYEVGDEVVAIARNSVPDVEKTLHKNSSGKYHFNLWEANRLILLKCGLQKKNIEILGECSFSEDQHYYSARRDGVDTGRMVSGIMLW